MPELRASRATKGVKIKFEIQSAPRMGATWESSRATRDKYFAQFS